MRRGGGHGAGVKRMDSLSIKDRRGYNIVHKASMRHRSIMLDSNDSGKGIAVRTIGSSV